jgi:glycosyltransferase involved in cell wall biosynthesis
MSKLPEQANISAVIPTYNDIGRIGDALSSIVGQTLAPSEVVVSDDGSDDGTEDFVRDFAARHAAGVEVRYMRLPRRSGDAAARHAGIAAAHGQWIAMCDSDDVWAPLKLERQVAFIRAWRGNRIVLLGTHGYNMNDARKVISPAIMGPISERAYEATRDRGELFYVIHSSALLCRMDYEAVGGYSAKEYGGANEFDLFCRMADRGVVITLPEQLVYYRKRAGSMQIDLFWDRYYNVLRLTENRRRHVAGGSPISKQEFTARQAAAPARRLHQRMQGWGAFYYRIGATDIVNGRRVRGALELALAAVMDARRVRAGVRNAVGRHPRFT